VNIEMRVQDAIQSILELGSSLQRIKGGPFPTDLLSTLGELKVFLKLKERFPDSEIRFNRKGRTDISIGSLNIEVKTSNFKREEYGEGYGFALHIKKCTKHPTAFFEHQRRGKIQGDLCYLDYLVCVAINNTDLSNPRFYIFSRDELNSLAPKIQNKSRRFWYAPYRVLIPIRPDPEQKGIIYNEFDLTLAKDKGRFKDRWNKIQTR
jgi:hypothetical protein